MGMAYIELIRDPVNLLVQMHCFTAAASDPDIRVVAQRGMRKVWETAASVSGASDEALRGWLAMGMLCNMVAALGIEELDEPWANQMVPSEKAGKLTKGHLAGLERPIFLSSEVSDQPIITPNSHNKNQQQKEDPMQRTETATNSGKRPGWTFAITSTALFMTALGRRWTKPLSGCPVDDVASHRVLGTMTDRRAVFEGEKRPRRLVFGQIDVPLCHSRGPFTSWQAPKRRRGPARGRATAGG